MTNRQAAIKVVKRLRKGGFEALLAGGCVRDMLLGRGAKDFDVATDAKPKDVMGMVSRVNDQIVSYESVKSEWLELDIDLSQFAGKHVDLEIENRANDWSWEFGFWGKVEVVTKP